VVLNLVGGFQALGTLLSVGLMMLPAATARFWVSRVGPMCVLAVTVGGRLCLHRFGLYFSPRPSDTASSPTASQDRVMSMGTGPTILTPGNRSPM
ncbi:MAG: metal ABC transporter permease, partial [Rhizobiaceae bacterium]